eukprot:TRINITY_DN11968_c0_g1_i1.p1 TRINITY_DN11968_c0_g1~~TRINITY_DN11968_c0_g1_i1.p1  ORF type:complete len:287 (+),score=61.13 TRINITY_DN11968_c0_g1_i1:63-923(+)
MPRQNKHSAKRDCVFCLSAGDKSSEGSVTRRVMEGVCDMHKNLMTEKMLKMSELCGGSFPDMIEALLTMGYDDNRCTKSDFCLLIHKINKLWSCSESSASQSNVKKSYNVTQAFKKFCRKKYSENKQWMRPPPKNAATKREFVRWAEDHGVSMKEFEHLENMKEEQGSMEEQPVSPPPATSFDSFERTLNWPVSPSKIPVSPPVDMANSTYLPKMLCVMDSLLLPEKWPLIPSRLPSSEKAYPVRGTKEIIEKFSLAKPEMYNRKELKSTESPVEQNRVSIMNILN